MANGVPCGEMSPGKNAPLDLVASSGVAPDGERFNQRSPFLSSFDNQSLRVIEIEDTPVSAGELERSANRAILNLGLEAFAHFLTLSVITWNRCKSGFTQGQWNCRQVV